MNSATVDIGALLGIAARVLDIGVRSPSLAHHLAAGGHLRYIGLTPADDLARIRREAGPLGERFHPLATPDQAVANSTDVLVLRGRHVAHAWRFRDLQHVGHLLLEDSVEARLVVDVGRRSRRWEPLGVVDAGGETFRAVAVHRHPRPTARRYVSPAWGVPGLLNRLDDLGLRYAVLRWFDELPDLPPGEDLDVLLADDDLPKLEALLAEEPGTIPLDLYTETGLEGTDWNAMAYYPPAIATGVLDRAVHHASGARVPAPADHFRSLAYHALYHKGPSAGLPSTVLGRGTEAAEHDYASTLHDLADLDVPITMEDLDDHLADVGWRPPLDTLLRLSPRNAWVRERFFPSGVADVAPPETTVFVVRERMLEVCTLDEVCAELDRVGFEIVLRRELGGEHRDRCATHMRGGNWGRGPFATSGGQPAVALVSLHHGPQPVDDDLRSEYPWLSNGDVHLAKQRLRQLVRSRVEPGAEFNPLHSSDNELDAWEYVELAAPDAVAELRGLVAERRAAFAGDVPVLATLSRGRRAKVELVLAADGLVVRKTFAPAFTRHFERELHAIEALADIPAVTELLRTGPNWLETRYYDDLLRARWSRHRLVPLPVLHDMVTTLRAIHERGYGLIDAKPENFLLDPTHGLRVVDFEFLHRYPGELPPFERSYSLVGVDDDYDGDRPLGPTSYEVKWLPWTGMPLDVLLRGDRAEQLAQRARHRAWASSVGPHSVARGTARSLVHRLPGARAAVTARYAAWAARRAGATA